MRRPSFGGDVAGMTQVFNIALIAGAHARTRAQCTYLKILAATHMICERELSN